MFTTAPSPARLNFEKRVIGTSSKLQCDVVSGMHGDTKAPVNCTNLLLLSHGSSSSHFGCTLRSNHGGGLEMLTADPPLCLDSCGAASPAHRRQQKQSFSIGRDDDYYVEDDNVVVEGRDSTSPTLAPRSNGSETSRMASLVQVNNDALSTSSAMGEFTSSPKKKKKDHSTKKERGKEVMDSHDKSIYRSRNGINVLDVTHSSVTRSQDSEVKGPMHVSLAHKALIGKGSFGVVFQAMDRDTNHIIAVKEIFLLPGAKNKAVKTVRKELALLKLLDHPHIVRCLGEECDESCLRIYMEYVSGGSISSVLRTFGPFQEKQASVYTRQMLEGLKYLHSKSIMHRDLKGDNLLVDPHGTLKISDFGTAKNLLDSNNSTTLAGTAHFMAPEVILAQNGGLPSDIWSVGCCVIEMLTGSPPFAEVTNQYSMMMRVAEIKGELFPDMIPKGYTFSQKVMDFLQKCLHRDPSMRPTADALLQDPWIVNPSESGEGFMRQSHRSSDSKGSAEGTASADMHKKKSSLLGEEDSKRKREKRHGHEYFARKVSYNHHDKPQPHVDKRMDGLK